jgi:tetratricopeptide (TPR) repeat protein
VGASLREGGEATPTRLVNPRAQDAYFRGLGELTRNARALAITSQERESLILSGIAALEEATRIEPGWPAAHAQLASAYHWLASGFEGRFEAEYYPRSKEAALRALMLDPQEPQALASLGFVLYQHERAWDAAEEAILRSLELGSNAHGIHALLLSNGGRPEEAIPAFRRALQIDPLADLLKQQYAATLHCAGRTEESIALVESFLPTLGPPGSPGTNWPRALLATSYSAVGRHPEALALAEWSVDLGDSASERLADLAHLRARAGDVAGARDLLVLLEARDDWWMARAALAELGETERAVDAVERSLSENPRFRFALPCAPETLLLVDHPRMRDLVRREGYPGLVSPIGRASGSSG